MAKLNRSQVKSLLTSFIPGAPMIIECDRSVDGQYWLSFKSTNGKVWAHTETYKRKDSAEYAVAKFIEAGLYAKYVDKTPKAPKSPRKNK